MGIIDGDLVPSTSGTSHLGVDARGATNFDISSLSPFGHVHQLSGVFHNESGSSGILRYGDTSLEVSNDGGKTYVAIPSPLSIPGNTNEILFNDGGILGTDYEGLTFNGVQNILGISGAILLKTGSLNLTEIGPPQGSGTTNIKCLSLAEYPIMGLATSGQNKSLPYFIQPALFTKYVFMIFAGAGGSNTWSTPITSVGTNSGGTTTSSGVLQGYATASAANSTAGVSSSTPPFCRAAVSGINSGFFFATRITLPDTNLDEGRVFVGLIDGLMSSSVTATDPGGNHCGFTFQAGNATAQWQFSTRDGTTRSVQDTGISCSGNRIWDMYIYSPPFPNNDAIFWTLHDVSWNRISNGYAINNLPLKNTMLRAGMQINNVSASIRSIFFQSFYCESLF